MHGLDTDTRATVPAVGSADVVAGIFFTLAPFVESEVLAAHDCFCCMFFLQSGSCRLTVAGCPRVPAVRFGS